MECAVCPHASTIHTTLEHSVVYISLLDSMYGFMSNHCQKLKLSFSVSEENWAGQVTQILADLSSFLVLEQQSWRKGREYNKPHSWKRQFCTLLVHLLGWPHSIPSFLSSLSSSPCMVAMMQWLGIYITAYLSSARISLTENCWQGTCRCQQDMKNRCWLIKIFFFSVIGIMHWNLCWVVLFRDINLSFHLKWCS